MGSGVREYGGGLFVHSSYLEHADRVQVLRSAVKLEAGTLIFIDVSSINQSSIHLSA